MDVYLPALRMGRSTAADPTLGDCVARPSHPSQTSRPTPEASWLPKSLSPCESVNLFTAAGQPLAGLLETSRF